MVQGYPRRAAPLTAREEGSGFYGFYGFYGFNRGGAAHKNRKAPQNFGSASRRRHLEQSLQIFLAEQSTC